MDPFVTLTAAATATTRLKIGTGVCLVAQRDPIQTAKLVASIDQVSGGRFLFGVGGGWNAEEMADHGTALQNPLQADARADRGDEGDLDRGRARVPRRARRFPEDEDLAEAGCKSRIRRSSSAAPFPYAARRALAYGDGWVPHAGRPQYSDVTDFLPQFRQMAAEAGRSLDEVPVTVFGVPEDQDRLKLYRDRGIARAVVSLPSAKADEILPILDRWAELIRRVA